MNDNSKLKMQLLRDPNIKPTEEVLLALLGGRYKVYEEFEWRYYNDGKAWLGKGLYKWKSARGNDKEKTIFLLSIWDEFFKVSIFIAEKAREGLNHLKLNKSTVKMIEEAKQMGKLKFFALVFEVYSDLPDDLAILMNYQKSLK